MSLWNNDTSFRNHTDLKNITDLSTATSEIIIFSNTTQQAFYDDVEESVDLSDETADAINFAFECVTMPILISFGVAGNILSLIVLSHRRLLRSTTTYLLIGLAVSDCLYLISTMIRKSTCIISRFNTKLSYKYFVMSFSSIYYINTCFSRTSTLLVAAISVERLIAVLCPLKIKLLLTRTRVIVTVISCFIFTFAFLSLLPVQYVVDEVRGFPILRQSHFYKANKEFVDIYNEYITVCMLRWLPKVVVVVCNGFIIGTLWKRRIPSGTLEQPTNLKRFQRTQTKVTIMLVTVAIVFVVTLLPGDAFWIASIVEPEFGLSGSLSNYFTTLSDVVVTFEIFNASINFVIYMALNTTFSHVYLLFFCPCLKRTKRLKNLSSTMRSSDKSSSDIRLKNNVKETTLSSNIEEDRVRY